MNLPGVHSVEEGEVWSPRQGLFLVRAGERLEGVALVFHFTGWKMRPMKVDYGYRTVPCRSQYWVRWSLRPRFAFFSGINGVEVYPHA